MEISYAITSAIERATQDMQRTGVVTALSGGKAVVTVEDGELTLPYLQPPPQIGDIVQILAVRPGAWLILGTTSAISSSLKTLSYSYSPAFTTSSTVYVNAQLSMAFFAPPSGKIVLTHTAKVYNSADTGDGFVAPRIRERQNLNAVFSEPNDSDALENKGTNSAQFSRSRLVTGLTPGVEYLITTYARQRVSGTMTVSDQSVITQPVN